MQKSTIFQQNKGRLFFKKKKKNKENIFLKVNKKKKQKYCPSPSPPPPPNPNSSAASSTTLQGLVPCRGERNVAAVKAEPQRLRRWQVTVVVTRQLQLFSILGLQLARRCYHLRLAGNVAMPVTGKVVSPTWNPDDNGNGGRRGLCAQPVQFDHIFWLL